MKPLFSALILVFVLSFAFASAENAPAVTLDIVEVRGAEGSFVRYPVLGGGDEAQAASLEKINRDIRETARIDEYVLLLETVAPGATGLHVTCEYALGESILSVLLSAEGKMLSGRPAQVYYPMTFDLRTGERMPFDALFADPDAARARIDEIVSEDVVPALSTYLENADALPVPYEQFFLSGMRDITFYYNSAALSFLSGRSGAVSVQYHELDGNVDADQGRLLIDILKPTGDLKKEAQNGRLAGLSRPVAIGDAVEGILDKYRAESDSGYYPGGAYIETEDARLRGTYILTDESEETVTGIVCTRYDADVITGLTHRDAWRELLGEPDMVMPLSGAAAQSYLLCDGESDYYLLGARQLILHANSEGFLYAIAIK